MPKILILISRNRIGMSEEFFIFPHRSLKIIWYALKKTRLGLTCPTEFSFDVPHWIIKYKGTGLRIELV